MENLSFALITQKPKVDILAQNIVDRLTDAFKKNIVSERISMNIDFSIDNVRRVPILNYVGYLGVLPGENCVYVDNTGEAYYALMRNIAKQHNYQILHISYSLNKAVESYAFTFFNGSTERHVSARLDGKWVFYETGSPMEFEEPEFYKKRKVKDRLNIEVLQKYTNKFGLESIDQGIFQETKILFRFLR